MGTFTVRLTGREAIADGTIAFHFAKPRTFRFKPGQSVDVVLGDRPASDSESIRHAFSLVSAPFQPELVIATRMRHTAFKRALAALPIGSPVTIEGPFGSLALHEDRARPAMLIAGGIGITPFMSVLRQAAQDQSAQRLVLLYSNRRPEDAAFLPELQELERRNKNFRLVATMTQMGKSTQPWHGETAPIDENQVKSARGDLAAPIYYVVGPPSMVNAMREVLSRAGARTDDVRTEEFYGY